MKLLINRRRELFGKKDVKKRELELDKNETKNNEGMNSSIREFVRLKEKLITTTTTAIDNLISSTKARTTQIENTLLEFKKSYNIRGFKTLDDFLSKRLPLEEREKLQQKKKRLDDQLNRVLTRKEDRHLRLKELKGQVVSEQNIDDLKESLDIIESQFKAISEELGALKERSETSRNQRSLFKDKQELVEKQNHIVEEWFMLHEIIGSADGKKFRNFAQGLTFELMVNHANIQLKSMTDRYLLVRDREKPLELNVIDNYQAGEVRSTKNISGGESFIISLSLALGLSSMASSKVKVDSLFLDEGFGTLDQEALETALETLGTLHQSGKLIGIISHIPALKDRITTQIIVNKVSGGRSIISGPGCKKMVK